jgi:hypothetical protein
VAGHGLDDAAVGLPVAVDLRGDEGLHASSVGARGDVLELPELVDPRAVDLKHRVLRLNVDGRVAEPLAAEDAEERALADALRADEH